MAVRDKHLWFQLLQNILNMRWIEEIPSSPINDNYSFKWTLSVNLAYLLLVFFLPISWWTFYPSRLKNWQTLQSWSNHLCLHHNIQQVSPRLESLDLVQMSHKHLLTLPYQFFHHHSKRDIKVLFLTGNINWINHSSSSICPFTNYKKKINNTYKCRIKIW